MGIKFNCPNGHKLNVKSFLAGRRGICPHCDARFRIPMESGGVAELVQKGDRGGDATQLTAAMQDDMSVGEAAGGYPSAVSYDQSFGSPLGSYVSSAPWTESSTTASSSSGNQPMSAPVTASPVGGYPVASGDPLSEDPQAVWYVRPRSGGQYGPAVADIMRDWIREGRVAGDSYVWREGWTDWRSASSVFPQLAGLLSTGTSVAAANFATNSLPTGGNLPAASVPSTGGAVPVLSAIAPGGLAGIDTKGGASISSPAKKVIDTRRRKGNFTALVVMLLVVVAIVLVAVFAWVLFKQPESSAGNSSRANSTLVQITETSSFSAYISPLA